VITIHQHHRRTDRRTTCDGKTCTIMHHTVMKRAKHNIVTTILFLLFLQTEVVYVYRVSCGTNDCFSDSALQRVADGAVCDATSKSQQGRRVKQPRPTRSASRDDVDFRGVICRFVMSFDGRQTHLNISTEFRQVARTRSTFMIYKYL